MLFRSRERERERERVEVRQTERERERETRTGRETCRRGIESVRVRARQRWMERKTEGDRACLFAKGVCVCACLRVGALMCAFVLVSVGVFEQVRV